LGVRDGVGRPIRINREPLHDRKEPR
jgi:hypothetical protein